MTKLTARKLSSTEIQKILKKKIEWIVKATQPEKIILFGSAATGQMSEASDIDLILIFESDEKLSLGKKALYLSRPKDDWPQDLLLHTESTFQKSVAKGGGACWLATKEGQVIYSKEKS